jgi:hypothetical protein
MTTFTFPYPEILMRKDWDKKKGVFAKMAGQTGVGEQCDKVQAAYKKVNWIRLNAYESRIKLGKWGDDTFTRPNWEKLLKDASAEASTNLAKVGAECYKLRDLCQKVAVDFKKSKTVPSSAADHVLKMAKAADQMGVALNKASMGDVLNRMNDEFLKYVRDTYVTAFKTASQKAAARHTNLVKDIRSDPTVATFNNKSFNAARDVATGLGNIQKAFLKGFIPRDATLDQIYAELKPYAGNASGTLLANASADQVTAAINKFDQVFTKALKYAQSLN